MNIEELLYDIFIVSFSLLFLISSCWLCWDMVANKRHQAQVDKDVARIITRMEARRENNKPKLRIVK